MKWLAAGVHGAIANELGWTVRIADAAMLSLSDLSRALCEAKRARWEQGGCAHAT